MKLPRSATIDGKRYRLVVGRMREDFGKCDPPNYRHKTIRINPSLLHPDQSNELLTVLLHEGLHAADFDKDERWAETVGRDLAQLLVAFGYSRREE
jgi:hypothetical protein